MLCLVFAILITCVGFVVIISNRSYVRCNKFVLGDSMSDVIENTDAVKSDYDLLVDELNNKYFEKVCDIFEAAKTRLKESVKSILGGRYDALYNEIKNLRTRAESLRTDFDNEPYTAELKQKLETAKNDFVSAKDENEKAEKKAVLNSVLSEIAARNLKVFVEMSELKKQINAKCDEARALLKENEALYKTAEAEVIADAKKSALELAVSYKSEIEAVSAAFDVKDYSSDIPFMSWFNPDMRLIDFDKNGFLDAFYSKAKTCKTECNGDCKGCAVLQSESGEDKNFFTSAAQSDDKLKN